jgi:hypothetical protein
MKPDEITAWATVAAAVAAFLGVIVAWVQLHGIKKGLGMSSLMAVLEIETQMNERKVRLDDCSAHVKQGRVDNLPKESMVILAGSFECALENYLNAMDRLCYCVLHGFLEDKDWRAEYRNYINNAVKEFPNKFDAASPYRNIKSLNDKWQAE